MSLTFFADHCVPSSVIQALRGEGHEVFVLREQIAANRDLFVGDPESRPNVSARFILQGFDRVFSSLTKDDVLGRHEESYPERPDNDMRPAPQSGKATL